MSIYDKTKPNTTCGLYSGFYIRNEVHKILKFLKSDTTLILLY
jgi:hypothetical protein